MELQDIRKKYLNYFKKNEHAVIPSASLVPENDPTTLFTGSGMQPLVPYLMGQTHPKGKRLTDSQKCFRSGDLDEVGDNRHTTFFEMLGNWSLGDYFKQEQLPWFFHFLTEELGLDPKRLYVTVFEGDKELGIGPDEESVEIWKKLFKEKSVEAKEAKMGSEEDGGKRGMKEGERIFYYDVDKNWWSRAGAPKDMPAGEIGGPDSEVFYEFTDVEHDKKYGEHCHPNCDCGRFLEIGNSVFIQYLKNKDGSFSELPNKNVDFGGGLERLVMASTESPDIIKVCHAPIIAYLEKNSGKTYGTTEKETRAFRIIADHMKAAVFLITEGVHPSNTDQGYFVRRLIRRSVHFADTLNVSGEGFASLVEPIAEMYGDAYPALKEKVTETEHIIAEEERKFRATLAKGMRRFENAVLKSSGVVDLHHFQDQKLQKLLEESPTKTLPSNEVFNLITTYGFPRELIQEIANERNILIYWDEVEQQIQEHKKLSRAGSEQKFKGGLADSSETITALHTVTHIMLAGLRKYLGHEVHQAGSNITEERLRFDFTYPEKVEQDVLDKVEDFVNAILQSNAVMKTKVMGKEDARESGVEGSFWDRYPDEVTVYTLQDEEDGTIYSQELCGGPHIKKTADVMGTFKIKKESSSSAGVRRIKAVLE